MKTIELHPAAVWDCDECGRENFCRLMRPTLTDEDREYLENEAGISQFDQQKAEFLTVPTEVKCEYCGHEFLTHDDLAPDEDGDDDGGDDDGN